MHDTPKQGADDSGDFQAPLTSKNGRRVPTSERKEGIATPISCDDAENKSNNDRPIFHLPIRDILACKDQPAITVTTPSQLGVAGPPTPRAGRPPTPRGVTRPLSPGASQTGSALSDGETETSSCVYGKNTPSNEDESNNCSPSSTPQTTTNSPRPLYSVSQTADVPQTTTSEDVSTEAPRNYLLSVVVVTNATMYHIKTVFPKYFPTLTSFFEEKQIHLEDLVCSARDLWGDEFTFEHFYEFWKCWTLEDVLNQFQSDGVSSVTVRNAIKCGLRAIYEWNPQVVVFDHLRETLFKKFLYSLAPVLCGFQVLSIGDDEPERKAAGYVRQGMPDFVKGTKLVKMVSQPDVAEISVQVEYLIRNLREYIQRPNSFDILYTLEHECSFTGFQSVVDAIQVCNKESVVIKDLAVPGDAALESSTSGETRKPLSTSLIETKETAATNVADLDNLSRWVKEVPQTTTPNPPHPFDAALIQFGLKFDLFYKVFNRFKLLDTELSLYDDQQHASPFVNPARIPSASDSLLDGGGSACLPFIFPQLADDVKRNVGLRTCLSSHVGNVVHDHGDELLALGHDCVGFLKQMGPNIPSLFAPCSEPSGNDDDDYGEFVLDGKENIVTTVNPADQPIK